MGNLAHLQNQSCKEKVSEIIDESRIQIQRFNPFSRVEQQIPYAEPLQENLFAGTENDQRKIEGIIQMQQLKRPEKFKDNDGYEYDEKFWKKQNPNVVIRGHWYRRMPHGQSTFYFPGGKRAFVAYFDHGVPIYDDCLIIFENGAYYHGGLRNFKFHGLGKYVSQDESVIIEGQWSDGVPLGRIKEKLNTENQIIQFDGQYNSEGERVGKNCVYTVKNKPNESDILFEYRGAFQSDGFIGQSVIRTQRGKYQIKSKFNDDKVEINELKTEDFSFQGNLQRNFVNGHGKFSDLRSNIRTICEGDIQNGILDGNGSMLNQDGSTERVYWFQGVKLKHMRHFDDSRKLKQMLNRIEQAYQKSSTYTEMTKILADQYKEIQVMQTAEGLSPRGHHDSYLFEMISRDKANSIVGASKSIQPSPLRNPKKELIIELDKGKFLYVTCFKIHPNENGTK